MFLSLVLTLSLFRFECVVLHIQGL